MSIYIQWVQVSLNRVSRAGLKEDGDLGSRTQAAITAFQEGNGVTPADGVVRPATITALVTAGADQPPVWALGGLSTKYEPAVAAQPRSPEGSVMPAAFPTARTR